MNVNWWEKLQPLRIPIGWTVKYNKLKNIEPNELEHDDKSWLFDLTEYILHLELIHKNKLKDKSIRIDLGWYPDGDINGSFKAVAIVDKNWERPILEYSTRSKKKIVEVIEKWLFNDFYTN